MKEFSKFVIRKVMASTQFSKHEELWSKLRKAGMELI